MDNTGDLKLLLASRYPLVFAEETDESRFLGMLGSAASDLGLPVWVWSTTRGLARVGNDPQYGTQDARKALDFARDLAQPAILVFADAASFLQDPVALRAVKEFAQANAAGQTLVLTGPRAVVPPELKDLSVVWKLTPPTTDELKAMVVRSLADLTARNVAVTLKDDGVDDLVSALKGLSMAEAQRLVRQAALRDGAITEDDVAFLRQQKAETLERSGALQVVGAGDGSLEEVGGLGRLKDWLQLRGRAFEPAARTFGLEPPRGILITGVPGCGKSLVAKTLARSWNLPLAALDVSALYGPYVGESEDRLRDALSTAEAMAPAVLWIDEIEKAFASGGAADGGVSERILGSFLKWMQERTDGVFVVATSNDVSRVPPELLRKGRFDEIFFVDLPGSGERSEIFRLQLTKRGRDPQAFDLGALSDASDGFSGAEIEAAIVSAMYRAYAAGGALATADILAELRTTVPLSRTRAQDVEALREWSATRAVPAAGPEASPSGIHAAMA